MNKHTSFVMKPGEAAVRFRVQVAAKDAHAHAGLVVGLVGILFGIFVPRFRGYSVVVFAPAHGSKVAPSVHNEASQCKMQIENARS